MKSWSGFFITYTHQKKRFILIMTNNLCFPILPKEICCFIDKYSWIKNHNENLGKCMAELMQSKEKLKPTMFWKYLHGKNTYCHFSETSRWEIQWKVWKSRKSSSLRLAMHYFCIVLSSDYCIIPFNMDDNEKFMPYYHKQQNFIEKYIESMVKIYTQMI